MLTQLRQHEADGIVLRTVHPVIPPRVGYELTSMGKELEPLGTKKAAPFEAAESEQAVLVYMVIL